MEASLETPISTSTKTTFFNHVLSSTEEGKAEILNVVQYSILGVIPIVLLNKLVQRFIPDADNDKSSIEILAEVLIQIIVMFVGVVIIHRMITYIPTYSEFKYESLSLTSVTLVFMILILSIQTKLGIKVNIIYDRLVELWSGVPMDSIPQPEKRKRVSRHASSRGDQHMESHSIVPEMVSASMPTQQSQSYDIRNNFVEPNYTEPASEPLPANALGIGSIF